MGVADVFLYCRRQLCSVHIYVYRSNELLAETSSILYHAHYSLHLDVMYLRPTSCTYVYLMYSNFTDDFYGRQTESSLLSCSLLTSSFSTLLTTSIYLDKLMLWKFGNGIPYQFKDGDSDTSKFVIITLILWELRWLYACEERARSLRQISVPRHDSEEIYSWTHAWFLGSS